MVNEFLPQTIDNFSVNSG